MEVSSWTLTTELFSTIVSNVSVGALEDQRHIQ